MNMSNKAYITRFGQRMFNRNKAAIAALSLILTSISVPSIAQDQITPPVSADEQTSIQLPIAQLAAAADFVALVKVELTSYEYRRGFPISGYADLRVLIPYKVALPTDRISISETGLGAEKCYFPETFPDQDGARFLVFLAEHEDGVYRGHPLGCKLSVLVTDDHAYALRFPLEEHILLLDEQLSRVEPMTFNDPFAIAGAPELTPGRKQALAEQVNGIVLEQGVKYTQGIPIRYFRDLIGRQNIHKPRLSGKY